VSIMESDGNGGYVIQKGVFALIMVIIALLSCVATVVAYGVSIKSDVDMLKTEYTESRPRHIEVIDKIETRISGCEKASAETAVMVKGMQADIIEIKSDVKELIKR